MRFAGAGPAEIAPSGLKAGFVPDDDAAEDIFGTGPV
jgi:hypothetical protein